MLTSLSSLVDSHQPRRLIPWIVLLVGLFAFLSTSPLVAQEGEEEPGESHSYHDAGTTEPGVVHQTEGEALAMDNALLAQEKGLPLEDVERSVAFQDAFADYADSLLAQFPDQITAVWMEPVPNMRGHIHFIGDIPPTASNTLESSSELNTDNVVLAGNGLVSMDDHFRRAELAAEMLLEFGYQNTVTFYDQIEQVIQVEILLPEEVPAPSEQELVDALQVYLQEAQVRDGVSLLRGRAAEVAPGDLRLTILRGAGPNIIFD